jgi:hypothetical protein
MLIYLTGRDLVLSVPEAYSKHNIYRDAASLSRNVLQNEATEIICQDFLCCFNWKDLPKIIDLILSKMRKGCKLTIIEKDLRLISRQVYKDLYNTELLNKKVFEFGQIVKSLFSLEDIIGHITDTDQYIVTSKGFIDATSFSLIVERVR